MSLNTNKVEKVLSRFLEPKDAAESKARVVKVVFVDTDYGKMRVAVRFATGRWTYSGADTGLSGLLAGKYSTEVFVALDVAVDLDLLTQNDADKYAEYLRREDRKVVSYSKIRDAIDVLVGAGYRVEKP